MTSEDIPSAIPSRVLYTMIRMSDLDRSVAFYRDALGKRLTSMGVRIIREPGPMTHTADNGARDVIAFAEDPDGYRIGLIGVRV